MRGWREPSTLAACHVDVPACLEDELVRRMRELEWPTAQAEVRRRCWEGLQVRLAALFEDRGRA